jgi:retron-type reverse transcriptase
MDYLLSAVAKRFGLKYSRYADDMTFSSMHNVFQQDSEFLKELHRIIFEQGFHIKVSKTRLQKEGFRQEVTGLLVNEKVNVQKRYIKQLREWLYKWETYGYNKANTFFIQNYIKEKGNVKKSIPNMTMVLDGKLQYLKMVKGEKDGTYLKLKERFDALYSITSPINSILDIWENEGIDKAMEVFYLQNPKKSSVEVASNEQLDNVLNYQFIL